MSDYTATNEDLPEIFFRPDSGKVRPRGWDRATAVKLHYPEIKIPRSVQRRRDAADRSEREISLTDRRVFVRLSKKCQMWDWLRGLFEPETIAQVRAENSDKVMQFLAQMYAKFYRYQPYGVKWVTEKQYQWLKFIACHYLKVPNEQS